MKKFISLLLISVLVLSVYAQTKKFLNLELGATLKRTSIDCTPSTLSTCNLISNNNFNTNTPVFNAGQPFNDLVVTNWSASHGSPQLTDGYLPFYIPITTLAPPVPATGYAFMWSITQGNQGEGIGQKIPSLTPGHNYLLTFFKRQTGFQNFTETLDQFNIETMHCGDYNFISTPTFIIPLPPVNNQKVFCQTNFNNSTSWERNAVTFTALANHDAIWIYPRNTTPNKNNGVNFAYPELIDITNFSAGTAVVDNATCLTTIGPVIPNPCTVYNTTYEWVSPSGTIIPIANPAVSQQITVDATNTANVGVWKLRMKINNVVTTNNTCSNNVTAIEKTVTVASCGSNPCTTNAPQILNNGYLELVNQCSNVYSSNPPILPNQVNNYCIAWECGYVANLESNMTSGTEWYINGQYVAASGSYNNIGSIIISNNGKNLRHNNTTASNNINTYEYKVKKAGCPNFSPPYNTHFTLTPFPNNQLGMYKRNYTLNVNNFWYNAGPGATYTWSFLDPNVTVTDINPLDADVQLYFGPNTPIYYNFPGLAGTLTVNNSPDCNGVYGHFLLYNPNVKEVIDEGLLSKSININNIQKVILTPNPATDFIIIPYIESGSVITIYTLDGKPVKNVKANTNGNQQINISDLQKGLYILKVQNKNNTQSFKFVKI
jgi:hypothetical protein